MSMKVVVSENDREMVIASRGLKDGGELIEGQERWSHTLQANPEYNSSLKCAYHDRTFRVGELRLRKDPIPA
jgi:hypothetical protein